jgi:hypothetical protein
LAAGGADGAGAGVAAKDAAGDWSGAAICDSGGEIGGGEKKFDARLKKPRPLRPFGFTESE